jgi:hypothetical protein
LIGLIVLAAASRHLFGFLAATLLALLGCLILILPDATRFLVAITACLGSLLVSLAAMHTRRTRVGLRRKVERLTRAVEQVERIQSAQVMRAIHSASPASSQVDGPKTADHKASSVASLD